MKNWIKTLLLVTTLLVCLSVSLGAINVSLPVVANLTPGQLIEVPITVSDLTGAGVTAYFAEINFTEAVLNCTGVVKTGTLTSSWGAPAVNTSVDGKVTIGAYGVAPLTGQGTLLKVKFTVVGSTGQSSPLTFNVFQFNEGTPSSTTQNGYAYLGPQGLDVPNVTISQNAGVITLSWPLVSGAGSYRIESSDQPYSGFTQSGTTTGTTWSTTNVNKKFFRVYAVSD